MKTIGKTASLLAITVTCLQAAGSNTNQSETTVPPPTTYQIVSSGPNFNIWQWQTFEPLPNGQVAAHTHSYTELASGLNYQDATTGQWGPAQELSEPYSQGAIAQSGQAMVIYADNLNTAGAVDEETPDGNRLVSNILGMMYDDPATGQTVQIA